MRWYRRQKQTGQALVEFVLIGPVVFFIFFGIIQLFYMSFVFFAVQKSAVAICQNAAASQNPAQYNPAFDLIYTLAPLEKISPVLAETFLAAQCQIETINGQVQVTLHYPMIIWIPFFKHLFGQKFIPASIAQNTDAGLLQSVFSLAQLSPPDLKTIGDQIPYVHWFNIKVSTLDENTVPAVESGNSSS